MSVALKSNPTSRACREVKRSFADEGETWKPLSYRSAKRFQLIVFISIQLLLLIAETSSAQEIVLRDLSVISSVAVKSVDDEYLSLTDGKQLTWDRVLQARVDPVWQKQVNQRIKKFGLPLFRLKHRLLQKNIPGAYQIAQQWHENEEQQFSGDEANYLVCRAMMLGRIQSGERERSLESMLRALVFQQSCSQEFLDSIPELKFANDELKNGICSELLPVWTTHEQAQDQLNRLSANFDLDQLVSQWPGLSVYLSSMAIHARQRELTRDWNAVMGQSAELRGWQQVLGSNLSQTPLSILVRDTKGQVRVSAMYLWATESEQQATKADRVLTLLKIVANYGAEFPDLSKMALTKAVDLTDDPETKQVILKTMQAN